MHSSAVCSPHPKLEMLADALTGSWCDGEQEIWLAITSLEESQTAVCRSRAGLNRWSTSKVELRPPHVDARTREKTRKKTAYYVWQPEGKCLSLRLLTDNVLYYIIFLIPAKEVMFRHIAHKHPLPWVKPGWNYVLFDSSLHHLTFTICLLFFY